MAKRKQPTKPVMVRMDQEMRDRIDSVARANGLTTSDIVRLSVARQLPSLRSGQTKLIPA